MIARTLPLELQLHIIELAVPPLTSKNLDDIRQLMRTLPLVSRAWKEMAYSKVPVVPRLVLREGVWEREAMFVFKAENARAGRTVRRFDLDLCWWDAKLVAEAALRVAVRNAEELWLELPAEHYEWVFNLARLRRLFIGDTYGTTPSLQFRKFPPRLTHLALCGVKIPPVETTFDLIDTLILDACYPPYHTGDFIDACPSLQVLALHETSIYGGPWPTASGLTYADGLRHILLSGDRTFEDDDEDEDEDEDDDEDENHEFKFSDVFASLTVRYPPFSAFIDDEFIVNLRRACEDGKVALHETVCPDDDGFDVEEWALSVRGSR